MRLPKETASPTSPMLRRFSAKAVFDALRAGGPMTGSDLMAATGINRSTVHEICNDLIGAGWIRELDPRRPAGESRRGRRARVYEFNADAGRVLGIDLGAAICGTPASSSPVTSRGWEEESNRPAALRNGTRLHSA